MEKRILIVNRNGVFSALPSEADYKSGVFLDNPAQFFTYVVRISLEDLGELYALRDRLMVIGPDLPLTHPEHIVDIDHDYVVMQLYGADWSLQRVPIPESAYLSEAKRGLLYQLATEEAKGFSVTTSMFGAARTFDSVTLSSLRSWIVPDGQTINLPSAREGMTSVDAYNREQINQLAALYDQERATWHNGLMTRAGAVHKATTRAELSLIK